MNNNTPINNYQKTLAIIWSWDHELSQKDIADQLQQFADCGVSQVMIEWAAGGCAFWSEKWHHCFQAALVKAHSLGLHIVLRDSNLHTNAPEPGLVDSAGVARYLNYKLIVVGKGERIVAPLPEGELVGARAYRLENGQISTDHSICLDDYNENGILNWVCTFELALVTMFCSTPDGVCSCNQFIFDDFRLHNLEDKLADIKRRYHSWLGSTLNGIALTVAACQHTLMWTTQFPEQFSLRTGYSLIDHMALLVVDGNNCETVRRDYHDVAGDLIIENFLEPGRKWIHNTGLRLYGGLSWEENADTLDSLSLNRMRLLRHVDSALVEQVPEHRNLLSLAMARLVHKDDIHQTEAVLRGILSQPIDEATRRVEEAVKLGAEVVWLDTVESSRPKAALNVIKKLLKKETAEPSQQPAIEGVGIYHPCKTLAAYTALSGKLKGLEENPNFMADGERARRMTIQLEQLCEMLDRRHIQLNVLDTMGLCGMHVNNEGALQARLGGASFHSIILPGVLVISLPELLLLEEFVSRGGHLVAWGSLPTHSSDETERKRLSECCERLFGHSVNPKQMNQNPYGEGIAVFIPFEPGTEIACIENIIDLVI